MRPYGAWAAPTEEDELEKALNKVPDEVSVEAAPFIQEGSLLAAGGGEPSFLEEPMVLGSKQTPADAAKFAADHAPPPQANTREAMLRKVFEAQQKHDEEKSQRMARGARLDRKRQNEDDLGAILYAATARKAPQFRNVGNSYSQEAASVGNDGPLSRELALQKVLSAYQTKPEDTMEQQLKAVTLALKERELNAPPKAEKPERLGVDRPLTPEERASIEPALRGRKLSPDATWREVQALVGPTQFATQFGYKVTDDARDREDKKTKEIEDQAERLAKDLGGGPAKLKEKLDRIDLAISGKSDIPGIGKADSLVPDFFMSDEGLRIRNEAKDLTDALLFMQSGQGVSDRERQAKYRLYGIEGGDERSFRDGMKRLRMDIAAEVQARQAGVKPGALNTYKNRGGTTADDIAPRPSGNLIRISNGKETLDLDMDSPDFQADFEAAKKDGFKQVTR